jgi:hypothetical protein
MSKSQRRGWSADVARRGVTLIGRAALGLLAVTACGPIAHIPPRPAPQSLPGALAPSDSDATLAHTLAPVLYLQRDETFPLSRVVAVVFAERHVVAYHLLWRDDAYGAWLPFTIPTDEEIVWVGYDPASRTPTDVWTYWHGKELHVPWNHLPVEIDVQWGKHGSIPRGMPLGDLPWSRSMNFFYAATIFGVPDLLLGRIQRKGPICFCHGSKRYREFTRMLPSADRLDGVVRPDEAKRALGAVFGVPYSDKRALPLLERKRPALPDDVVK